MKNISESTGLTVGLVAVIATLAFWIGTIASTTSANSNELIKLSENKDSFQREVLQRLTHLEALLESGSPRSSK